MYAGCQQQRPRVWQGLGRAGHAGQSPSPAAQPCQGALRKEHVFRTAGFPLAAPPAHSLPRAPLRGRPARPRGFMKTKQKLSQAGLDITRAWLGPRMLSWGSVCPGAHPQAARGTLGQRQGAPRCHCPPRTAAGTQKYPLLPGTPSSLPRCQEGVPDGCPGGA